MNRAVVVYVLHAFFDIQVVLAFLEPPYRHYLIPMHTLHFPVAGKRSDDSGSGNGINEEWTHIKEIAKISSPWVSIYCERLLDNYGQLVDYWRVEKAASCIIIVVAADGRLILPKPQYRPGIGRLTLDFCGGRCDGSKSREEVGTILQRELSVDLDEDVVSLVPLNYEGWYVNSSFSDQLLFGFVAKLKEDIYVKSGALYFESGDDLLDGPGQLTCLQCRAVLMQWMLMSDRRILKTS